MSENVPKSPELLQAQSGAFLAEHPMDFQDRQQLLSEIGVRVRAPLTKEISLVTTEDRSYRTPDGQREEVPRGTERVVSTKEDYAEFLRHKGGAQHEDIANRAAFLEAYKDFAPAITTLKKELEELDNPDNHPAIISSDGTSSRAYRLLHEGKEYVVIMQRFKDTGAANINQRMAGAARAKGVDHLEQMVAASYEEGVTISERMPGVPLSKLSPEQMSAITPEQLAELAATLKLLRDKNIYVDFTIDGGNILYDPENGFGFIDIGITAEPPSLSNLEQRTAQSLAVMGAAHADLASSEAAAERVAFVQELAREFQAICAARADELDDPLAAAV